MKKLLTMLMVICMIVGLAACKSKGKTAGSEGRPAGWDADAQVLKWLNGLSHARTVEELAPYVSSDTTKADKEYYISQITQLEGDTQISEGGMETSVYIPTYEKAETTLLGTFEGYEILHVKLQIQNDDPEVLVSTLPVGTVLLLKIENGRYVTNLSLTFGEELQDTYEICYECHGGGTAAHMSVSCFQCWGAGVMTQCVCDACGESFETAGVFDPEEEKIGGLTGVLDTEVEKISGLTGAVIIESDILDANDYLHSTFYSVSCPECYGTSITMKETVTCSGCDGKGGVLMTECQVCEAGGGPEHTCTICDGKGYIKH